MEVVCLILGPGCMLAFLYFDVSTSSFIFIENVFLLFLFPLLSF